MSANKSQISIARIKSETESFDTESAVEVKPESLHIPNEVMVKQEADELPRVHNITVKEETIENSGNYNDNVTIDKGVYLNHNQTNSQIIKAPKRTSTSEADISEADSIAEISETDSIAETPKIKYGLWKPSDMGKAIAAYTSGKIGLNAVCRKYKIPKPTFKRHVACQVKRGYTRQSTSSVNGGMPVLHSSVEEDLVKHILLFEECLFGLTILDVRKLAFDIAEKNSHLGRVFKSSNGMVSKGWYYSFMKRHPYLSLRQPESISIARCKGFNRTNVSDFFTILEKVVDQLKFTASKIYNVDESSFATVQKKNSKVISKRGKSQIVALASQERGVNTTAVCCVSAAGHFIPPMIIFRGMQDCPALAKGAPIDSLVRVSESGYINSKLFVEWLQHFIKFTKSSVEDPILLLLDGHSTHSKTLEAINLARANGIVMIQLPGHTTHRLQPLDVSIFKPMQTFYDERIQSFMREHPGEKVTQYHVCDIFRQSYEKVASISNAISGFAKTGIWPMDREVFTDADFAESDNLIAEHGMKEAQQTLDVVKEELADAEGLLT